MTSIHRVCHGPKPDRYLGLDWHVPWHPPRDLHETQPTLDWVSDDISPDLTRSRPTSRPRILTKVLSDHGLPIYIETQVWSVDCVDSVTLVCYYPVASPPLLVRPAFLEFHPIHRTGPYMFTQTSMEVHKLNMVYRRLWNNTWKPYETRRKVKTEMTWMIIIQSISSQVYIGRFSNWMGQVNINRVLCWMMIKTMHKLDSDGMELYSLWQRKFLQGKAEAKLSQ